MNRPQRREFARPAEREQDGVAQLHRADGKNAHQKEDPNQRTRSGACFTENVEAGNDVVGETFAKADLSDEVREHEREGERDGHGQTAELTPRIESDDATAHELRQARHNTRQDGRDVGPREPLVIGHAIEQRDLLGSRPFPGLARSPGRRCAGARRSILRGFNCRRRFRRRLFPLFEHFSPLVDRFTPLEGLSRGGTAALWQTASVVESPSREVPKPASPDRTPLRREASQSGGRERSWSAPCSRPGRTRDR